MAADLGPAGDPPESEADLAWYRAELAACRRELERQRRWAIDVRCAVARLIFEEHLDWGDIVGAEFVELLGIEGEGRSFAWRWDDLGHVPDRCHRPAVRPPIPEES